MQKFDKVRAPWPATALISLLVGALIWLVAHAPELLEPKSLNSRFTSQAWVNPVNSTKQLCSHYECVEAWRTDVGTFLRFDREGKAEHWALVCGDQCRRNGAVIVDFGEAELTRQQKKDAIDLLFPGKDWY